MLYSGLVSVTFRQFKQDEVIELAKKAGLDGIEWGGDMHVPHGDTDCAARVLKSTRNAGLKVASYGSYYRVGEDNGFRFKQVLETAKALEAPVIRVWAGKKGSSIADEKYRDNVVKDSIAIAEAASAENIKVAFEFHKNTLTDTNESALHLLKEINHSHINTYWQPSQEMNREERLHGLKAVIPWLSHIHVFHWENGVRLPLASGMKNWKEYMNVIHTAPGDRYAMLEFIRDNDPLQFLNDAACLKEILNI